ncbi:MAG: hypothetical protein C4541_04685 [Candidatus Auribacter fodinae]|uniref:Uncharacterized protein n=1 Tax=Candidatus Auribacter fodinae TaxID=2093366 RepID=A0A3A4R584_9BACT|nr:MAG: hypothetical protein C4541_04685 [Candidatus Auribacter fodinae]
MKRTVCFFLSAGNRMKQKKTQHVCLPLLALMILISFFCCAPPVLSLVSSDAERSVFLQESESNSSLPSALPVQPIDTAKTVYCEEPVQLAQASSRDFTTKIGDVPGNCDLHHVSHESMLDRAMLDFVPVPSSVSIASAKKTAPVIDARSNFAQYCSNAILGKDGLHVVGSAVLIDKAYNEYMKKAAYRNQNIINSDIVTSSTLEELNRKYADSDQLKSVLDGSGEDDAPYSNMLFVPFEQSLLRKKTEKERKRIEVEHGSGMSGFGRENQSYFRDSGWSEMMSIIHQPRVAAKEREQFIPPDSEQDQNIRRILPVLPIPEPPVYAELSYLGELPVTQDEFVFDNYYTDPSDIAHLYFNGDITSMQTYAGYYRDLGVVQNGGALHTGSFQIGYEPDLSASYTLNGGELSVSMLYNGASPDLAVAYIGVSGKASMIQSGGAFDADYLTIAFWECADGNYVLNNGSVTTFETYAGYYGNGSFTHNSGTHTTNRLVVGAMGGSRGTYNHNGGSVQAQDINVGDGYCRSAAYNLQNGSVATNWLTVGYGNNYGYAEFNMSGGVLQEEVQDGRGVPSLHVGTRGKGRFIQSGGTHNFEGTAAVAYIGANNGSGYYGLSGGTYYVDKLYVGINYDQYLYGLYGINVPYYASHEYHGTFTVSDGAVLAANDINIGDINSRGLFVNDGGKVTTSWLAVGIAGGYGTLQEYDGSITAYNTHIGYGAHGYYLKEGGAFSSDYITFGYADGFGSLVMGGGTISSQQITAGDMGEGVIELSGGTIHSGSVIWGSQGGVGSLIHKGGTIKTTLSVFGSPNSYGTGEQTGGRHDTEVFALGESNGNGKYALRGGILNSRYANIGTEASSQRSDFLLDGGMHLCTELNVGLLTGSRGIYTAKSGTMVTNRMRVGVLGNGALDIKGRNASLTIAGSDIKDGSTTVYQRGSLVFGLNSEFFADEGSRITLQDADFVVMSTSMSDLSGMNNLEMAVREGTTILEAFCVDYGAVSLETFYNSANPILYLNALIFDGPGRINFYMQNNYDNYLDMRVPETQYIEYLIIGEEADVNMLLDMNLYYLNLVDLGGSITVDTRFAGDLVQLEGGQVYTTMPIELLAVSAGEIAMSGALSVYAAPEPSAVFLSLFGGLFLIRAMRKKSE